MLPHSFNFFTSHGFIRVHSHMHNMYIYIITTPLKMLIHVFVVGCGTEAIGRRDAEEKRKV